MGDKTGITWTDATWGPIVGCSRVSEGCRNCYAEREAASRLSGTPKYQGLARMVNGHASWTGELRLWEPHLDLPLRWRKPRRIFVNSMSDLFHEKASDEWIGRIFEIMGAASQHCYQILTKRPERMFAFVTKYAAAGGPLGPWPWPHVWLGVSVEDQATADARIPLLLQTPAAVRWVSYEPALGPVDFQRALRPPGGDAYGSAVIWKGLDWYVVGGESGPGHRAMELAWLEKVDAQTRAAGVPLFVKQDSGPKSGKQGRIPEHIWRRKEFPSA